MMRLAGEVWGDVRYGARLLRRTPGFTIVAALSLALGIAGAASVFSLLNAIVLRPLPVANPEQLFTMEIAARRDHGELFSAKVITESREALAGRAELFAATGVNGMQLWPDGETTASRGRVQLVSGEYFSGLRERAQLGRLFTAADNQLIDGSPVAVASDAYWRGHLGGRPDAIGHTIRINGATFTIIGVTMPGFFGTTVGVRNPDVWIPYVMQSAVRYAANASNSGGDSTKPWTSEPKIAWLNLFVRTTPREAGQAAAAVSLVLQREALALLGANPSDDARKRAGDQRAMVTSASGGVSTLRRDTSTPLLVLLAMVGVLLAIACGNVAGLLLARAAGREREVAIRLSIGASRMRIVRQMLAESLLLGLGAGLLGLAVAAWLHDPLLRLFVPTATVVDLDTGLDWRVLAFVAGVSVLTGVACGIVPALRNTRVPLTESLKQNTRSVQGGRRGLFAGKTLVAVQMAFCLLLLVVAGLFARSLQALARTDVGFDAGHLLVADLDVRSAGYPAAERLAAYQRILDRIGRIPGVESASLSANGPLNNSSWRSSLAVEGHTAAPDEQLRTNEEIVVGPYFDTVGLKLVEGHLFEAADHHPETKSTIINATMAHRFFPNTSAIGKRWSYGGPIDKDAFIIVGVVEDARYLRVRDAPPNMAYHPAEFDADELAGDLEIRTGRSPVTLVPAVRQALAESEPQLPVTEIVPMTDRVSRGLSQERSVAQLSSAFGALALLLACLGLYGTVSYGISRRVAELGLRMALGADRTMVLRMVLREALALVALGAGVGLPLALMAARSVRSQLYEVAPADMLSFAVAAGALVIVAASAAAVPAYRASRIAPIVALNR